MKIRIPTDLIDVLSTLMANSSYSTASLEHETLTIREDEAEELCHAAFVLYNLHIKPDGTLSRLGQQAESLGVIFANSIP